MLKDPSGENKDNSQLSNEKQYKYLKGKKKEKSKLEVIENRYLYNNNVKLFFMQTNEIKVGLMQNQEL